jgi:hypothetical protein
LDPNGLPKTWSIPINKTDEKCKRHYIAYGNADEGQRTTPEADELMPEELKELKN